MKRFLVLLAAAALLCAALSGCTQTPPSTEAMPPTQPETEEADLARCVLSDWSRYLVKAEALYGDMLWGFSYVDAFANERSWENLQLARMAFYTAENSISTLEPPETELEYENYDRLIQAGKDVAFIQPVIDFFADEKDSVLLGCQSLRAGIGRDVFWEPTLSTFLRSVECHAQIYECHLRYLAAETEYLLLALDDVTLTERFCSFLTENCPRVASFRAEGDMERQAAIAACCADELEALMAESAKLLGESRAALPLYAEAAQAGTLSENAVQIEGLPILAPYPDWYHDGEAEAMFSWTNRDGTTGYPSPGEALERTADSCILTCPGVRRDDVLAYRDTLEYRGLSCQLQEEEDLLGVTCFYEGGTTLFLWAEGTTHISMDGNPLCFVPDWYWTSQNT